MPTDRQRLGERGEALAEAWLTERGYTVAERNYRCPYGEIDRIMREGERLVFVEVKTRRNSDYGSPAESVTPFKQRQISRAALHYLQKNEAEERPCRFDVVEVLLLDGAPPQVRHLPGVFDAVEST